MSDKRPAWREPMVWLIAALPLAAVVGGITMLVVSIRAGNTDAVADDVQRTAQIQTADLGPDERAQQRHLGAVLRVGKDAVQVFAAGGDLPRSQPLQLSLLHPTQRAKDQTVELAPDEQGWHAPLALDATHDWNLMLTDTTGEWRLRGRLPHGQRAAHLGPSIAPP